MLILSGCSAGNHCVYISPTVCLTCVVGKEQSAREKTQMTKDYVNRYLYALSVTLLHFLNCEVYFFFFVDIRFDKHCHLLL